MPQTAAAAPRPAPKPALRGKPIAGPERAALLILGLDEGVATEILKHLDDSDMAKLAEHVAKVENAKPEDLDRAFAEFAYGMEGPPPVARDGAAYVRRLATVAVGEERARRLLPASKEPTPLDQLRAARASTLAELLADEHPQIAAVVVAQLPRDQAAKVLMSMPEERQSELLARLAGLEEVPAQAAQLLSETVAKALGGDAAAPQRAAFDGISYVAGLLNEIPVTDTERLLGSIEERAGDLVPKVREKMFTFEDLLRLPVRNLQGLMKEVPTESLLVALKTASEALREHFLGAVSSRAAAQLREDLQLLPPTRLSDVERAQREIVESALRLAAEGKITLPGPSSEAMV
jgi:flagellar motor switch protein FliG